MPPLPADFIHARACKLKCEKILTRPRILMLVVILLINLRIENGGKTAKKCFELVGI